MKRIAFVEMESQMSGVEFSTLYLARQLDRACWEPLVICPAEGDLPDRCRAAGISVAIVPRPHFFATSTRIARLTFVNPLAWFFDSFAFVFAALRLARFLLADKPDLVVPKGLLAQFYGGLAARWADIPCVWHIQDRVSDRPGGFYAALLGIVAQSLARHVIVDAESIARQLTPRVPPERLSVIWNGVDPSEFSPRVDGSRARAEWNVGADVVLIGAMGRFTPWKGQHILLHAFAKLADRFPQARVVLIGSALFDTDEYARSLKNDVARMGLAARVVFAGFRADTPHVLAALDVFAHTPLEKDSTPLAVVSAMAMGKPIVCSRVDGTAELFDEGVDGLLVPIGDVDVLAEQLARVIADADLRGRLGRAARAKAERELSAEQFARKCEQVFAHALGNQESKITNLKSQN